MQRRTAIKQFLIIAGGVMVIPSCLNKKLESAIDYKHLKLTGEDEKVIAELGETLLPAGKTPGAKDAYAHLFALRMVDDCTGKEVQQSFQKGLKEFKETSEKRFGTSFLNCSPAQRQQLVAEMDQNIKGKEDIAVFYSTLKKHIIRGYLNSKPVLGGVYNYKLTSAPYNGSASLKTILYPA